MERGQLQRTGVSGDGLEVLVGWQETLWAGTGEPAEGGDG